jgi:hypothetical protein
LSRLDRCCRWKSAGSARRRPGAALVARRQSTDLPRCVQLARLGALRRPRESHWSERGSVSRATTASRPSFSTTR